MMINAFNEISARFYNKSRTFADICEMVRKQLQFLIWSDAKTCESWKCWNMGPYLQTSASIKRRTDLQKFEQPTDQSPAPLQKRSMEAADGCDFRRDLRRGSFGHGLGPDGQVSPSFADGIPRVQLFHLQAHHFDGCSTVQIWAV